MNDERPRSPGPFEGRLKGLEPSTFCMASGPGVAGRMRFLPANEPVRSFGGPAGNCPVFCRGLPGLCQPIVNRSRGVDRLARAARRSPGRCVSRVGGRGVRASGHGWPRADCAGSRHGIDHAADDRTGQRVIALHPAPAYVERRRSCSPPAEQATAIAAVGADVVALQEVTARTLPVRRGALAQAGSPRACPRSTRRS